MFDMMDFYVIQMIFRSYMPFIRIAAGLAIVVFSVSIFFNPDNASSSNRTLSAKSSIDNNDVAYDSEDSRVDSCMNCDYIDKDNIKNSLEGSLKQVKHKK